ncbi:MAG: hypothetical protein AAF598_22330, partial [Bacteroidota bacterium]
MERKEDSLLDVLRSIFNVDAKKITLSARIPRRFCSSSIALFNSAKLLTSPATGVAVGATVISA